MKKILIIDDEPNLVELIQIRLESHEFEILTASNGVVGYAIAKDEKPDLIVLDINMPTMDGYQFIKEIKWHADLKNIPILILTAKAYLKDLFEEEYICGFVTKPFNSNLLISNIKDILDESRNNESNYL